MKPLTEEQKATAEANIGLARWAASWLAGRGVPADDAESDGRLALVLAAAAWTPGRYALSTYVRWYCRSILSGRARRLARRACAPVSYGLEHDPPARDEAPESDAPERLAAALPMLTPRQRDAARSMLAGRVLSQPERQALYVAARARVRRLAELEPEWRKK